MRRKINQLNYLENIDNDRIREEVFIGLKARPRFILPKFFYDSKGSELFHAITQLNEYYLTRVEKSILSALVKKLNIDFSDLSIIELGSGDNSKISLLLRQIPEDKLATINYFSIDISSSAIEMASESLANEFPEIGITGIVADFIHQQNIFPEKGKKLFCFFGSTMGNLNSDEIEKFMKSIGAQMKAGDSFLLGLDMIKDVNVLEKAYNDEQQITAGFNRNILHAVNSLTNTNFIPKEFKHLAFYNKEKQRIEMHLEASKDMEVNLGSPEDTILIKKGETIHTENSRKFNNHQINNMGAIAGLDTDEIFTDEKQWFSVVHYKKKK